MQPTLPVLAAVAGAIIGGLFALLAALITGLNAQNQTRFQHYLEAGDHARQER